MIWSLKTALVVLSFLFITATVQCSKIESGAEGESTAVAAMAPSGSGGIDMEDVTAAFPVQAAKEGILNQDPADDPEKDKPQEKTEDGDKKGKLQRLKKGSKGNRANKKEIKYIQPQKQDPAKRRQPQTRVKQEAKVIKDIEAFRQEPATMITRLKERFEVDFTNVDYDAPVIAVINGEEITKDKFRMNVIDSVGALEVDRFITACLTEVIKEKLIAEGAAPGDFTVPDKMVEDDLKTQALVAKQQDRSGQFNEEIWREQISATFGWERFVEMTRSILSFGIAYLPEIQEPSAAPAGEGGKTDPISTGETFAKPGEEIEVPIDPSLPVDKDISGKEVNIFMPLHTWKLLDRNDQDRNLRDIINKAYRLKTPLGSFMRPHYIRMIQEAVIDKTEILYYSSGKLPDGVYMRVGGRDVLLDEIYPIVTSRFRQEDKELVLQEMLVYHAMDSELKEKGHFPAEEDFAAAFEAHEKIYEGSLFPLRFIMRINGYLSKENYKKMYFRRHGFEKMLKAEGLFTDEAMERFFQKSGRLFYQNGGVKVQLIFFGVYDHKTRKIRENGFEWAEEQMAGVLKELEEPGADFLAVAKKYENTKGTYNTCDFDYLTRNDLRSCFDEKTKTILNGGYSLADDIFYNKKEGEIVGPILVTRADFGIPVFKGAYLIKVVGYRSMQSLRPFEESRPMVEMDYVDLGFLNWAAKALARSDIKLTRKS